MALKVGGKLYSCYPFTAEDGRVSVEVDEWVIRSIKKRRGSQTRWGVPRAYRDDTVYVNCTMLWRGYTINKAGEWMKNIPAYCRRQFPLNEKPEGSGLYTTPLKALKVALKIADTDAEIRAVKSRITRLRNARSK